MLDSTTEIETHNGGDQLARVQDLAEMRHSFPIPAMDVTLSHETPAMHRGDHVHLSN